MPLVLASDVVSFLALLLVVGVVLTAMAPEARERLRQVVLAALATIKREATRSRPENDQFREALRARTRWAVVTPALIVVNVTVFFLMVRDAGAVSDPETMIRWGGN